MKSEEAMYTVKILVKVRRSGGMWGVRLTIGANWFWLDYCGTWKEARHRAKALKTVLSDMGLAVNTRVQGETVGISRMSATALRPGDGKSHDGEWSIRADMNRKEG